MFYTLRAIREDTPGEKWKSLFEMYWPSYEAWFLSEGFRARPGYLTSIRNLEKYMPELIPTYENLVKLAGDGDLAARFLSMYCPPPYLAGCSQAVWTRNEPVLVRNYDYSPRFFEGVLLYTNWLRPVIAMSDCMWGVLDGMNNAGLVVSLSFGGRKITGEGFGLPLILRYVLETCDDTQSAVEVLKRIPTHMAYNVTLVDRNGNYATVYLLPEKNADVDYTPVSTNHQRQVEWHDYARLTSTEERLEYMTTCLNEDNETLSRFIRRFLSEPLYNTHFEKAFGTLYTVAYHAKNDEMALYWRKHKPLRQSFTNFTETHIDINFLPVKSYLK